MGSARSDGAVALDWIVAGAVCGAVALFLLVGFGFAIVSDCTTEPGCSTSACFSGCRASFYGHWAIAAGGLAAVTVVSVPMRRRMAAVPILLSSFGAAVLLIRFR